jgi:hypothetical protein
VQRSAAATKARFREVQLRAQEDPEVRSQKRGIHAARTEAEQQNAMKQYQRTLYLKMRELDPSLEQEIDRAEAGAPGAANVR